jgi:hypothetical protein
MIKLLYIILLVAFSQIGICQITTSELEGTKWGNDNLGNCMQHYLFKEDNNFEYYNCEMDESRTGTYSIIGNKLSVLHYHMDDTPAFAGGTGELQLRFQFDFIIEDETMKMVFLKDF